MRTRNVTQDVWRQEQQQWRSFLLYRHGLLRCQVQQQAPCKRARVLTAASETLCNSQPLSEKRAVLSNV